MRPMKTIDHVYDSIDIVNNYAIALQKLYYRNERYFDMFTTDDFDGLDNAVGSADCTWAKTLIQHDNYKEAIKEIEYSLDWFKMMNDKCRRRGWDYNASQRGFDTTKPIATVWAYTSMAMLELQEIKRYLQTHQKS